MANRHGDSERDDLDHRFDRDVEREPSLLRRAHVGASTPDADADICDALDGAYSDARGTVRNAYLELHGAEPTQDFVNEAARTLLRGDA